MRNRHDLSGDPADDTIDPYIISLFVPRKVEKKFGVILVPGVFRYFTMTHYKPYSPEWHRYRYLAEALNQYLDDYVENDVIVEDIQSILNERSEASYADFNKVSELESKLRK